MQFSLEIRAITEKRVFLVFWKNLQFNQITPLINAFLNYDLTSNPSINRHIPTALEQFFRAGSLHLYFSPFLRSYFQFPISPLPATRSARSVQVGGWGLHYIAQHHNRELTLSSEEHGSVFVLSVNLKAVHKSVDHSAVQRLIL